MVPVSATRLAFGSVTTNDTGYFFESHCIKFGLIQKRVLPEPDPPQIPTNKEDINYKYKKQYYDGSETFDSASEHEKIYLKYDKNGKESRFSTKKEFKRDSSSEKKMIGCIENKAQIIEDDKFDDKSLFKESTMSEFLNQSIKDNMDYKSFTYNCAYNNKTRYTYQDDNTKSASCSNFDKLLISILYLSIVLIPLAMFYSDAIKNRKVIKNKNQLNGLTNSKQGYRSV